MLPGSFPCRGSANPKTLPRPWSFWPPREIPPTSREALSGLTGAIFCLAPLSFVLDPPPTRRVVVREGP